MVAPRLMDMSSEDAAAAAAEEKDELTSLPDAGARDDQPNPVQPEQQVKEQLAGSESAAEPSPGTDPAPDPDSGHPFSRLDPNRRSFSTPSVNTVGAPSSPAASKPAPRPPEQRQPAKLRRRTALGLISLGPAHFRLSGRQGAQGAGSSWRSWFLVGRSVEGANNAGGGGSNSANASPGKQSSGRKFRLRSHLRAPSSQETVSAATTADQQVQVQPQLGHQEPTRRHVDSAEEAFSLAGTQISEPGPKSRTLDSKNNPLTEDTQRQQQDEATVEEPQQLDEQEATNGEPQVVSQKQQPDKQVAANMKQEERRPHEGERLSLVDRLIDSELEWRQLIRDANGGSQALSQLSELQIKRQEVIHELVQTERHHCLTLALMRQVYLSGLRQLNESRSLREAQMAQSSRSTGNNSQPAQSNNSQPQAQPAPEPSSELIDLDRLFPALEELIQVHELFFAHLRLRLVESCRDPSHAPAHVAGLVGPLGALLCDQFRLSPPGASPKPKGCGAGGGAIASTNGQKLLQAYGKFCGQHYDSSRYYKQLMQSDKGFKQFIELCKKQNLACRQRGIPECNLLVTQRLTKYPLLIEQLIKTSKDDPQEEAKLGEALKECKGLLAELNNQLARKESFERLLDIYAQFSPKSYTIYNRHLRFTKHDLLQHKRLRQLLHSDSQVRIWSATRRKLFQVLCLVLNDIVVFLRYEQSASGCTPVERPPFDDLSLGATCNSDALQGQAAAHLHSHHNQQQQLSLAPSQCALINVVASALQAPSPLHSLQGAASQPTSAFSVKYYFANIDNKSSVISLSKLLVREKAAHDGEPRIYLISSSPRQPEMYELAFVSRRHQVSFVEKLKSCIEQHNKSGLSDQLDRMSDEDEDELEMLHAGHLSDLDCDEHFDDDLLLDAELADDAASATSLRSSHQSSSSSHGPNLFQGPRDQCEQRNRKSDPEFEHLDIEQDVVTPPPRDSNTTEEEDEDAGEETHSFVYATPTGCQKTPEKEDAEAADASVESGLSERAKDSLDEAGSTSERPRLRGARRRRAQRPRQVSNQSSSSSEAAHRQAIQLISTETNLVEVQSAAANQDDEEFDSGRGHDDSSSAASTSSNSLGPRPSEPVCAPTDPDSRKRAPTDPAPNLTANSGSKKDRILDLKLLRGSISTSSITSALLGSLPGAIAEQPAGSKQQQTQQASAGSQSGSSSASSTASGGGSTNIVSLAKCGTSTATKSSASCQSFAKQRKLSTVSTMSSQLKLFNKLKNGYGCDAHLCSRCNTTTVSATATGGCASQQSTLSKQVRQQLRRSSFIPEQKLEELRDLRIQLDKDKQEWQAKFDAMQEQLLNERRELDLAREKLKQDRQQVANEREQLYRKLDILKEKGILLSPSHKVIITAPQTDHLQQQQQVHYQNHFRQPMANLSGNHSASIRIQQQPQTPQIYCHGQLLNGTNYYYSQPVNKTTTTIESPNSRAQNQSTNLFIQSSASSCRVPLHLSEGNRSLGRGSKCTNLLGAAKTNGAESHLI